MLDLQQILSLSINLFLNFHALAIQNYAEMSVCLKKKRDVTESRYGQNMSSSSLRRLEQVVDQGMRDGKGVHTIRYSYYHREKGAENT